jgi:TfoX/Sxy family transcriptional regulator of competence genes
MAYSEALAERIRKLLGVRKGVEEKKMFGGVGFLLYGNICVGVWKTSLIARLGPDAAADALSQPYVRPFDITGRAMKGWVLVDAEGIEADSQLHRWIERAENFVSRLPPKDR